MTGYYDHVSGAASAASDRHHTGYPAVVPGAVTQGDDLMDYTEQFLRLVEENGGFELCHAYRDEEDHFLGGKQNNYWYVIVKHGKQTEACLATMEGGTWSDCIIKGSGRKRTQKALPAGSTIKRIQNGIPNELFCHIGCQSYMSIFSYEHMIWRIYERN